MGSVLINRVRLSDKALLLMSALLLIINISGDHVFNKVNNLKVILVVICLATLSLFVIRSVRYLNLRILIMLMAPVLATLPGALFSSFKFSYGLPFELSSQILCVMWSFLLYSILLLKKQEEMWKVLWVFVPTIYFVCIIAALEKIGLAPLTNIPLNPFEATSLTLPWKYQGLAGRVESTFGNINYFANFLIQVLPLTIALFLITRLPVNNAVRFAQLRRVIIVVSGVLVFIALILTQTRSAILAALLSMIVFALLLAKVGVIAKKRLIQLGLVSILILILLALIMMGQELDRFSALLNKETWWPRTIPWQAAWNSFFSAPFFGHGIGASYQLFFEYIIPDSRLFSGNRSYNHVHNELLQILQEGGLFGLLVYLAFWSTPFWLGIRYVINDKHSTEMRILISALLCGLIAYHIHGLFSVAPRMISSRIIAYSLLAILMAVLIRPKIDVSNSRFKKVIASLGIFSIIGVPASYLLPFSHSQHQYVDALASTDRVERFIELAEKYDDIYILEAAAKEVFAQRDAEKLLKITDKANNNFPHFRQMDIYQAYALLWQGRTQEAYLAATQYQEKDTYNGLANSLLLDIALRRDSKKDILAQLKTALEYQACKSRLLSCDALSINVLSGRFNVPFQIADKGNKWNVLIDQSFILKLKYLQKKITADYVGNKKIIVGLLSQGLFFKPKSNTYKPLSKSDYDNLTSYLNLINHNREVDGQVLLLEGTLEKTMDLKEFLNSRELLIHLSNVILRAINK
jgi:hypothetical protein